MSSTLAELTAVFAAHPRKRTEGQMQYTVSLKLNHVFRRLYRKGTRSATPCLALYSRPNGRQENRLGLTTGAKLGHAVVRNRCRRRLREVYRLETPRLRQGYDIILVARTRTATAPWPELQRQFRRLCRKLDLLEAEP